MPTFWPHIISELGGVIIQINLLKVLVLKFIFPNLFDADSDLYLNKSVHVRELPVHVCESLDLNQYLYWS